MGNVTLSNANATLAYAYNGGNAANLRCSSIAIAFTQISDESHARQHRAFYPHHRSQGTFTLTFDAKGWKEFNATMGWFRDWATAALNLGYVSPPPIIVSVPSRNFLRMGMPTQGIQYGDYLGSMVFTAPITFLSVSDPSDPASTVVIPTTQASKTQEATALSDPVVNYFYPDSIASYPGKLSQYLYDTATVAMNAQTVQAQVQIAAGIKDGTISVQSGIGNVKAI